MVETASKSRMGIPLAALLLSTPIVIFIIIGASSNDAPDASTAGPTPKDGPTALMVPGPPTQKETGTDAAFLAGKERSWSELHERIQALSPGEKEGLLLHVTKVLTGNPSTDVEAQINHIRAAGLLGGVRPQVVNLLESKASLSKGAVETEATIALCMVASAKAEGLLLPFFTSPHLDIRRRVCQAAPWLHGEAFKERVAHCVQDESPLVRIAAFGALKLLGHHPTEVVEAVVNSSWSKNTSERALALELIGEWKVANGFDVLCAAAQDEAPALRRIAARGLGGFERPEALAALVRLAEDQDVEAQVEAIRSLAKTGSPRQTAVLARKLGTSNEQVRLAVLSVMAAHPPGKLPGELASIVLDQSTVVRALLAKVLGRYRSKEARELLYKLLCDREESVATTAKDALARMEPKEVLEELVGELQTTEANFSRVVEVLHRISGEKIGDGPGCPPAKRKGTIAAWKKWWEGKRDEFK